MPTDTPCVIQSAPDIAFTPQAIWSVTYQHGPRCHRIDTNHQGCGLPPAHIGGCIPCAVELLDSGVRLHPVAHL